MIIIQKNKIVLLVVLILLGAFLRFYNLNWGAPFYFHPDERQNIAYPILQSHSLLLHDQKKFDTGTFPLVVIKITQAVVNYSVPGLRTIDQTGLVLIISRIYSALFSMAILITIYIVGVKIFQENKAVLALALATFGTGFIQFSHFGTIELWEAFLFLLLFFYSWRISEKTSISDSIICGIIVGISLATKILTLIVVPAIVFSFFVYIIRKHQAKKQIFHSLKKLLLPVFIFGATGIIVFLIFSPQIIYNFPAFYNDVHFESQVALGSLNVFYTQGFFHTLPVIFQFTNIYPFLLNPLVSFIFIPCLVFLIFNGVRKRNYPYLLLAAFYLTLFISQAFFFVKWTRYMVPILPFMYLIIAVAIVDFIKVLPKNIHIIRINYLALFVLISVNIVFGISYLVTAFIRPDVRVEAASFARLNIPQNAKILSEPFDIGLSAFSNFPYINTFDFYQLDQGNGLLPSRELQDALSRSDYVILPSQRLIRSRFTAKDKFPKGHDFYSELVNDKLSYKKIYETPCDVFCKITYLNNPIFGFEETANIFDRPTVLIFKKI